MSAPVEGDLVTAQVLAAATAKARMELILENAASYGNYGLAFLLGWNDWVRDMKKGSSKQ